MKLSIFFVSQTDFGQLIATGVCFVIFVILFIWYKRKTTLATTSIGHLHNLIPSLKEQKPSLNSLLPILLEFVHATKLKTTNLETDAYSQQSPTHNEHSITYNGSTSSSYQIQQTENGHTIYNTN